MVDVVVVVVVAAVEFLFVVKDSSVSPNCCIFVDYCDNCGDGNT